MEGEREGRIGNVGVRGEEKHSETERECGTERERESEREMKHLVYVDRDSVRVG